MADKTGPNAHKHPHNELFNPSWGCIDPEAGFYKEALSMNPVLDALFGNRTAACVLLFLQCYGEGHAQRIAKTFGFGLNMTQRQLKRLEEQGVLVSRRLGNMRLFGFNERNPTVRNLCKLLEAELAALTEDDQQQFFRQRQRPRQSNKPLAMNG